MKTIIQCALGSLLLAVAVAACSSSSDSGSASLQAPLIKEVMPMTGGLHVTWENKQGDCDTVEGERMMDKQDYASAFSVPGNVDNKMDSNATDTKMMYMYRLRCKKGDAYSGYSNEMSGMPN